MSDNAWVLLACAGFVVYAIGLWACAHYDYKRRVANIDELFKGWGDRQQRNPLATLTDRRRKLTEELPK